MALPVRLVFLAVVGSVAAGVRVGVGQVAARAPSPSSPLLYPTQRPWTD